MADGNLGLVVRRVILRKWLITAEGGCDAVERRENFLQEEEKRGQEDRAPGCNVTAAAR